MTYVTARVDRRRYAPLAIKRLNSQFFGEFLIARVLWRNSLDSEKYADIMSPISSLVPENIPKTQYIRFGGCLSFLSVALNRLESLLSDVGCRFCSGLELRRRSFDSSLKYRAHRRES
jgi:hypothetical protein